MTLLQDLNESPESNAFWKKCAMNVADTMMSHYWNHNVVTDGWESGADEAGFSDEEIEAASEIDLSNPQFKQLVIKAVSDQIKKA